MHRPITEPSHQAALRPRVRTRNVDARRLDAGLSLQCFFHLSIARIGSSPRNVLTTSHNGVTTPEAASTVERFDLQRCSPVELRFKLGTGPDGSSRLVA